MLMYGTLSGFLPRRFGSGVVIVLGVALVLFALYRYGGDFLAGWRDVEVFRPVIPAPARATRPAPSQASPRPARGRGAIAAPQVREAEASPAPALIAPAPIAAPTQSDTPRSDTGESYTPAENSNGSAYDSGIKRAAKRVGRWLHLRKKEQ